MPRGALKGRKWTLEEQETVSRLFKAGVSPEDIARQVNRTLNAVMVRNSEQDLGIDRRPISQTRLLAQSVSQSEFTGSMTEIAKQVAALYGVTLEQVKSAERKHGIAHARQEVMLELYATGRFSLPQIAAFLRRTEHSGIMHGIKSAAARRVKAGGNCPSLYETANYDMKGGRGS